MDNNTTTEQAEALGEAIELIQGELRELLDAAGVWRDPYFEAYFKAGLTNEYCGEHMLDWLQKRLEALEEGPGYCPDHECNVAVCGCDEEEVEA